MKYNRNVPYKREYTYKKKEWSVEYMAYNREAQKRYNEKTIMIAASYKPGTDLKEGQRVKAYLKQSGQTANSYIKGLIKADLDKKGFICDDGSDMS